MDVLGAVQDTNSFTHSLESGLCAQLPEMLYTGAINESLIRCTATTDYLTVVPHAGRDRAGKLWLGVEVVSVLDGTPRDAQPLDVVVAIDTSGSMASSLSFNSRIPKLAATKKFVADLAAALRPDDRLAVIVFCEEPHIVVNAGAPNVAAVRSALEKVKATGCENVPLALEASYALASSLRDSTPEPNSRTCRIAFFSDMCIGEVERATSTIQAASLKGAENGIAISYIGLGADFNAQLVEKLTVASGSNYFSICDEADFQTRIVENLRAAFFPVARDLDVRITARQYEIKGIYGAGKEGTLLSHQADAGWSRDRAHLYEPATKTLVAQVDSLRQPVPCDVIGMIVDAADGGADRPVTVLAEKSVFAAPIISSAPAGYQKGGWFLVALDERASANGTQGVVRFELRYRHLDGSEAPSVVRELDLQQALSSSDEGMRHVLALQGFVAQVNESRTSHEIPQDFREWLEGEARVLDLRHQLDTLNKLTELLARFPPASSSGATDPSEHPVMG